MCPHQHQVNLQKKKKVKMRKKDRETHQGTETGETGGGWGGEKKKRGMNELIMSHFYTGSSDYTNGGYGQKIFCTAYGTSAAICASFHKNWH